MPSAPRSAALTLRRAPPITPDADAVIPLLSRFPPTEEGEEGVDLSFPMDTPLPLFRAIAADLIAAATEDARVPVPGRHARHIPALVQILRPRGDLSPQQWAAVDMRALTDAAAYFMVPADTLARLLELGFHRRIVAQTCPQIAEAIARESVIRVDLAAAAPWSRLTCLSGRPRVPCATVGVGAAPKLLSVIPPVIQYSTVPLRDLTMGPPLAVDPLYETILREYDHVVIAGGAALGAVVPEVVGEDVDLFLWGVKGEAANAMVSSILCMLRDRYHAELSVYVTENAITVKLDDGTACQIILRYYDTPEQILTGFDIAASKVLLRANHALPDKPIEAWCTPEFEAAIAHGAVWVDPCMQSPSYTLRTWKYWFKGFDVLLFGSEDRSTIVPTVFTATDLADVMGIGCMLRVENDVRQRLHARRMIPDANRVVVPFQAASIIRSYIYALRKQPSLHLSNYAATPVPLRNMGLPQVLADLARSAVAWSCAGPDSPRSDQLFYHGSICPLTLLSPV